ncbi:hypothetical protein AAY473_039840 [Plecturocebus cupreus]
MQAIGNITIMSWLSYKATRMPFFPEEPTITRLDILSLSLTIISPGRTPTSVLQISEDLGGIHMTEVGSRQPEEKTKLSSKKRRWRPSHNGR